MSRSGPRDEGDLNHADLQTALASSDPAERASAIERARFDPVAEQAVIEALQDADPAVRRAAIRTLARWREPLGIKALAQASASDPTPGVRAEAVAALGAILASEGNDA
jgi:HEAT repeat protein